MNLLVTEAAALAVLAPFAWFGYRACTQKRYLLMTAIYGVGIAASIATGIGVATTVAS
jgi:hypothetical protein